MRRMIMVLAGLAIGGTASAQEMRELGNQGYRNGVQSFGGYYETFGGMGGNQTYGNYQRYKGTYAPTTGIFSIPLTGPTKTGAEPCSYLRQKAAQTGAKIWRARYQACKAGS